MNSRWEKDDDLKLEYSSESRDWWHTISLTFFTRVEKIQ